MALNGGFIAPDLYQNHIEVDRQVLQLLAGEQPGITSPGAFAVTSGAGLSVNVAAGKAFLDGKNIPSVQGFYYAMSDGVINVTIPAAAAQGRIDRVILAVRDLQYGALPESKEQGAEIFVVSGTPSATPVAVPDGTVQTAVGPGGWIELARVTVPANATSIAAGNIQDTRQRSATSSIIATSTTRPAGDWVALGKTLFETDTKNVYIWNGTAWQFVSGPQDTYTLVKTSDYFITDGNARDDPQFQVTVDPGWYTFDAMLIATSGSNDTDLSMTMLGGTWNGSITGIWLNGTTETDVNFFAKFDAVSGTDYINAGVISSVGGGGTRFTGTIQVTSRQTCGLRLRKGTTSSSFQVVVKKGSWLRLVRERR